LQKELCKLDLDDPIIFNFWDYARSKRWQSCAVPKSLVTSQVMMPPDLAVLPFARIEKTANKWSLPTMLESFYRYYQNEDMKVIKPEDLSLKGYLLWETPVYPDREYYHPICDMELISKIADFSDPRRVFLDYWSREESVITSLATEDHRGVAAADFLASITGVPEFRFYKATWYTQYLLPYDRELEIILSQHLPTDHENIIASWHLNQEYHQEYLASAIPMDFIKEHKEENKKFWRSRTKSKRKSEKAKRKAKSNVAPAPQSEFEDLSLVNMDDISTIIDDFLAKNNINPPTRITTDDLPKKEVAISPDIQPANLDLPDWLIASMSAEVQSDDESYDDQYESEDEDELIRRALDLYQRDEGPIDPWGE